jgi:hypothetical protein
VTIKFGKWKSLFTYMYTSLVLNISNWFLCEQFIQQVQVPQLAKYMGPTWVFHKQRGNHLAHLLPMWALYGQYGVWAFWSTEDHMGQLVWVLVIWGPDGLTGVTLSCFTCGAHMESYGQSGQNHSVKVIMS